MGTMTTVTHNDNSPEMLAAMRRGPFAGPTRDEMIEYLVGSWDKQHCGRPTFEEFAYEHVQSFQRRVHALKKHFMQRNKGTPRGVLEHYWDRTEAQARGVLHAHILEWWRKRDPCRFSGHAPVDTVKRTVPGDQPRQRHCDAPSPEMFPFQEDNMYYHQEVARVNAEMVRPDALSSESGLPWGGYDVDMMRIAGLARTIQARLYVHTCNPKYCLQGRATCRFFYPWPEQRQQQFDENTDRVALRRLYPADDRWVVPHDIELAMFSPATINVLPFDPHRNVSEAMLYAGKYVSKPKK